MNYDDAYSVVDKFEQTIIQLLAEYECGWYHGSPVKRLEEEVGLQKEYLISLLIKENQNVPSLAM